MCSAFNPDCRYAISFLKPIGDVDCSNTMRTEIPCVHKKIFILLAEETLNVFNARSLVGFAKLPLKNKQIRFP